MRPTVYVYILYISIYIYTYIYIHKPGYTNQTNEIRLFKVFFGHRWICQSPSRLIRPTQVPFARPTSKPRYCTCKAMTWKFLGLFQFQTCYWFSLLITSCFYCFSVTVFQHFKAGTVATHSSASCVQFEVTARLLRKIKTALAQWWGIFYVPIPCVWIWCDLDDICIYIYVYVHVLAFIQSMKESKSKSRR